MPAKVEVTPAATNNARARKIVKTRGSKCRREGSRCVWPKGIEERFDIGPVTRWRWERDGKLPPRDVFVNGVAVGWKPATLDAAARGEQ